MVDKPIRARDVGVESFEDTSRHSVESDFEKWKKGNPDCVILDMHYAVGLSPVAGSTEGEIFRIYTITFAYAKQS